MSANLISFCNTHISILIMNLYIFIHNIFLIYNNMLHYDIFSQIICLDHIHPHYSLPPPHLPILLFCLFVYFLFLFLYLPVECVLIRFMGFSIYLTLFLLTGSVSSVHHFHWWIDLAFNEKWSTIQILI